jgi:hypothetical protein
MALSLMRVAGYHDDMRAWTRLYVEQRVSFAVANDQFKKGQQARRNGVRCTCAECNNNETKGTGS